METYSTRAPNILQIHELSLLHKMTLTIEESSPSSPINNTALSDKDPTNSNVYLTAGISNRRDSINSEMTARPSLAAESIVRLSSSLRSDSLPRNSVLSNNAVGSHVIQTSLPRSMDAVPVTPTYTVKSSVVSRTSVLPVAEVQQIALEALQIKLPSQIVIAYEDYSPSRPDEMMVKVDDKIRVIFIFKDGWILGMNQRSGTEGILPKECVEAGFSGPLTASYLSTNSLETTPNELIKIGLVKGSALSLTTKNKISIATLLLLIVIIALSLSLSAVTPGN